LALCGTIDQPVLPRAELRRRRPCERGAGLLAGKSLNSGAMRKATMSIKLHIQGRVQGVWYRGWAVAQARDLGLSGWVRNRQDGSVEALVSGSATSVRAMIERCYSGPPAARVDTILEEPAGDAASPGFRQLPTI
jgi:acylphosphatase